MPYIIDGHNLIPKIAGLSLEAIDDEIQLIELLQEFCRLRRKKVEVYFDNSPAGGEPRRKFGLVTVYFIRQGNSADDAILRRLDQLGKGARNWTVVTSDIALQSAVKSRLATILPAEKFASEITRALNESTQEGDTSSDPAVTPDEIERWMEIFNAGDEQD
jgi:predicted RNA-binding protein with PIN domain